MTDTGMRHIPLDGAYNVRDIGGYATEDGGETPWKTFLRADSLNALTPQAQQQLLAYGVRTIIDLRSAYELENEPNVFADSHDVNYVNIPLYAGNSQMPADPEQMPRDLVTIYKYLLDGAQQQFLKVMITMLEGDAFPVLVHCTAGKDRTGMVTALMLDLAGVDDKIIAEDYALTGNYLGPKLDMIRKGAAAAGRDMTAFEPLLLSEPQAMIETLMYLDEKYGGAEQYLREIGLDDGQIAHFKSIIVSKE